MRKTNGIKYAKFSSNLHEIENCFNRNNHKILADLLIFFFLQVTHEFKNYGTGLARIIFCHGGRDKLFWAGHYGSKMAGASVCVMIPKNCTHKETTPEPIVQTQTDFLDLD